MRRPATPLPFGHPTARAQAAEWREGSYLAGKAASAIVTDLLA